MLEAARRDPATLLSIRNLFDNLRDKHIGNLTLVSLTAEGYLIRFSIKANIIQDVTSLAFFFLVFAHHRNPTPTFEDRRVACYIKVFDKKS